MIELQQALAAASVARIGRPWHGLARNAPDAQSASLTLDNGGSRPWPAPLIGNDAWLLKRPVARARLCVDVHAGTPGQYPPPDTPGWPLTTPAEAALGMRYLDYALVPHGLATGSGLVAFAADGTPWLIEHAIAKDVPTGKLVWSAQGRPHGRLGAPPAAWTPLAAGAAGTDRLDYAPYEPTSDLYDVPPQYAAQVISLSQDGKRLLVKYTATDLVAREAPISCVLGLFEVVLSGGDATTPPTLRLEHRIGWQQAASTWETGLPSGDGGTNAAGYRNIVIHAWYDALDEVELVMLDVVWDYTACFYSHHRLTLRAGLRLLAEATVCVADGVYLNGEAFPSPAWYLQTPYHQAGQRYGLDVRIRHLFTGVVYTGEVPGPTEDFIFSPRLQSNTVVSLYAGATTQGGATIAWSRWIGAATPGTVDTATVSDTGTVETIPAPPDCPTCEPYPLFHPANPNGTWHPATHSLTRNQPSHIAFV